MTTFLWSIPGGDYKYGMRSIQCLGSQSFLGIFSGLPNMDADSWDVLSPRCYWL